jgi:hypothetical protein
MDEDRIIAAILTVAIHSETPIEDAASLAGGGVVAAKFAQKRMGKTPKAVVDDYYQVLKALKALEHSLDEKGTP